jgi:GNAT superfamily N-acetyltransferase
MKYDDLERCVPVFLKAFCGAPWNEPWTEETTRVRLRQFMNTETFFGLVLEEESVVKAFILGQYEQYYDGLRFYIQEFCCGEQGRGYGTTLLTELESQLRVQGVVRTYLMTIHGEATEGYYQRRGYITDGDAVWMYQRL